jgi:diguanylate cyclase (GGDEF)-like protein
MPATTAIVSRDPRSTPAAQPALLLVVLWIVLAIGDAHGQSQHFRHYGAREGLMQAQVISLHQDQSGFLWAGTYGGLGRFNGQQFTQYSTADGLTTNTVQAIASEDDGTVWAGLARGLCALRPHRIRFECPTLEGVAGAHVQALLAGPDGVWVGTGEGLFLLRNEGDGGQQLQPVLAVGHDVASLAWADDGRLWAGGRNGLARVGSTGVLEEIALPGEGAEVRALLVDGERLWIGTTAGLLLRQAGVVIAAPGLSPAYRDLAVTGLALGPAGELWAATRLGVLMAQGGEFVLRDQRHGLSNANTHAVMRDREGVVWIAGDGGLSSYVVGSFVGYLGRDGLIQDFVRAIGEDAGGQLWLGTRQGVQVIRSGTDGRLDPQFTITRQDGLVDDRIYAIAFPAPDEALLATGHGLAHWRVGQGLLRLYTEEDGLPSNAVRALRVMEDGSLFIGTNGGIAVMRDGTIAVSEHPELAQARVFTIRQDTKGRLWFGSLQHGLLMLDSGGQVQRWTGATGVSDEIIWDTAPDAGGGIWVGSNGDGLFHMRANGSIARYTMRDGLPDNFVWQVLVDRNGHVWSYTNRGLSRFDGTDFWNYSEDDGLLHPEGAATAAIETASGERWFASAEGLMRFVGVDQERMAVAPAVVIEQALAGGAPMLPGNRLEAGARSLEFHFSAPLLQRNSDLRYRYRLRGADQQWTELNSYRPITYANLGGGKYAFEVQARMAGDEWPPSTAAFAFSIAPRLWQMPVFWIMSGLLSVALAWLAMRLRLRHIEARRQALEGLVGERTEALELANRMLEEASFTDPLTELRNRRYLASQVGTDVAQVRRAYAGSLYPNRDIIFLMIDVDHFKQINDSFGHAAGDRVLRQYARLISAVIRESDYAVRWGGEEFLLVARQTEAEHCAQLAERIVERVRGSRFVIDDAGTEIRSTCSVGVSHLPFGEASAEVLDWSQVIEICDAAVYMAKAGGRDGWVAIRGVPGRSIGDAADFMRRLKADPLALAGEGLIRLAGTHCPAAVGEPASIALQGA